MQCRFCDYTPCMCGRKDYGTSEENALKDQLERIRTRTPEDEELAASISETSYQQR